MAKGAMAAYDEGSSGYSDINGRQVELNFNGCIEINERVGFSYFIGRNGLKSWERGTWTWKQIETR
jgi:hypothetical protein